MKANEQFLDLPLEFWANVRFISQKISYMEAPSVEAIKWAYSKKNLDFSQIIENESLTEQGTQLIEYFKFRKEFLQNNIEPNLMKTEEAKEVFENLFDQLKPTRQMRINRQKLAEGSPYFFTGIINMLIESNSEGYECNFNPMELTAFTEEGFPVRTLSRRVDGCFPNVVNPVALWEIKEYYYTTTFGSRIADGVYESQLDGYELKEARNRLNRNIHHYLMVDGYGTWWSAGGKPYLCRICDMLQMNLLSEVLFGKEVIERIPIIVKEWISEIK